MTDISALPPVSEDEWMARFILFRHWIRKADPPVRPDAFIPYPYPNLSVIRHRDLSEKELWQIGQAIADKRPATATLYGRADLQAINVIKKSLRIVPTPEPKNHANITGWPADKPSQKIIAQEIAAEARFVPNPISSSPL
jgi:hypothetical protein